MFHYVILVLLSKKHPFILFTSAGVGRTGTYIACDLLLKSINRNETLNIFKTVLHLRKQRTNMVQTQVTFPVLRIAVIPFMNIF